MDRVVARPRGFNRILGRGAIVLAVAAVGVGGYLAIPARDSVNVEARTIETGEVKRAPFADYLPLRGTIAPLVTTFVTSASGGQVAELFVADGADVKAGQPLARLNNPELRLSILEQEANLTARLGDISAQQLALASARNGRDRDLADIAYRSLKANNDLVVRNTLHAKGIVSDAGVKIVADEANFERAQLARMQTAMARENRIAVTQAAQLGETRGRLVSNLEAVRESLDALTLRAPIAGRLTNFTGQPGQMIKPGDSIGQIDGIGSWKLVADVDEYYLGRVAIGQRASGDIGGAPVALSIARILPQVANGRFRVELGFVGTPPSGLNRGQTIDLRLTMGDPAPALVAPAGPWAANGSDVPVFVLGVDGAHAERRTAHLGRRTPQQVEILSGLKPGDRIITSSTSDYARNRTLNLD